ncbi:MAG: type II toxin-antitoxin system Phd/YefM family antitoxin [Desulfobacteraceae bacterium]|jgi:antitoxin (DNA-binding transcriptional repressor) of toxin-antitoxin stability system
MVTQKFNIHEAKTNLSAILAQIEKDGRTVLICRNGTPVAELAPIKKNVGSRLLKHPLMSNIRINYDPVEDMTDDEWA